MLLRVQLGPPMGLGMLRELALMAVGNREWGEVTLGTWSFLATAGFILTSFPRASHTSWNSLHYAHNMVRRSKWHLT